MKFKYFAFLLLPSFAVGQETGLSPHEAIRTAFESRPSVSASRKRIEESRAGIRAQRVFEPLVLSIGASSRSDIGATDSDLLLSQPLDLWGRTRAAESVAKTVLSKAEISHQALLLEIQTQVLTAYYEALAAKRNQSVMQRLATIAEDLEKVTQRRFAQGAVPEVQVSRAKMEATEARLAAEESAANLKAAEVRLTGAIGGSAEALLLSDEPTLLQVEPKDGELRPDVLLASIEVVAATKEARSAGLDFAPQFEIQAAKTPWSDNPAFYGLRVQLSIPLTSYGKEHHTKMQHRQKIEALELDLADLKKAAHADIEAAQIRKAATLKTVEQRLDLVAIARELAAKAQKAFSEGIGTQMEVLDANRFLRQVESEWVESRLDHDLATADYLRATGTLLEVSK